jgi:hypothetical protein
LDRRGADNSTNDDPARIERIACSLCAGRVDEADVEAGRADERPTSSSIAKLDEAIIVSALVELTNSCSRLEAKDEVNSIGVARLEEVAIVPTVNSCSKPEVEGVGIARLASVVVELKNSCSRVDVRNSGVMTLEDGTIPCVVSSCCKFEAKGVKTVRVDGVASIAVKVINSGSKDVVKDIGTVILGAITPIVVELISSCSKLEVKSVGIVRLDVKEATSARLEDGASDLAVVEPINSLLNVVVKEIGTERLNEEVGSSPDVADSMNCSSRFEVKDANTVRLEAGAIRISVVDIKTVLASNGSIERMGSET